MRNFDVLLFLFLKYFDHRHESYVMFHILSFKDLFTQQQQQQPREETTLSIYLL